MARALLTLLKAQAFTLILGGICIVWVILLTIGSSVTLAVIPLVLAIH